MKDLDPKIKPFIQNTLNPSELENLSEKFYSGWTSKYNTIQTSVYKKMDKLYELNPKIKPFIQNTLNPSELENLSEKFYSGWTSKYNTIQTSVYKKF